ncbi:MAG: hypothetical protein ACLRMZ_06770 [Blautia marasmi]
MCNIKYIYQKSNEINSFFTEIDILETINEKTKEDKKCEEKVNRFWRQPQQRPCCYQAAAAAQGSQEKNCSSACSVGDKMTDVGTPREDTLIVDMLSGTQTDPDNFNPYMTGCVAMDCGLHQLLYPCLWEADTMNGEQICDLAADFPRPWMTPTQSSSSICGRGSPGPTAWSSLPRMWSIHPTYSAVQRNSVGEAGTNPL